VDGTGRWRLWAIPAVIALIAWTALERGASSDDRTNPPCGPGLLILPWRSPVAWSLHRIHDLELDRVLQRAGLDCAVLRRARATHLRWLELFFGVVHHGPRSLVLSSFRRYRITCPTVARYS
jgi:hypothetical protein